MESSYAVRSLSWTREDGYVKVPHPLSRRMIYLPRELAAVFELVDEGHSADEIVETLAVSDPSWDRSRVDAAVERLLELQVIDVVSQFD